MNSEDQILSKHLHEKNGMKFPPYIEKNFNEIGEGWLKWKLWLGNSMLGSINSLQKQGTKIKQHTNL